MLEKYISDYINGAVFHPQTQIFKEICGVKINIQTFDAEPSEKGNFEKAHIVFEKNDLKYECICIDHHHWDNFVFPIKLGKNTYLCFRKTLYGFTFLNAETLTEEYNYFPEKVTRGDESFIIVDAVSLGDLIIFYGCYWGAPYECYAYDHFQKLFIALSLEIGIMDSDEPEIKDGKVILKGTTKDDVSKSIELTETDIRKLLKTKGESEF